MKVFAPMVELPGLAVAELVSVKKRPKGMVGVYRLQPTDPVQYVSRFGDSQAFFRQMYSPAPGLWATFSVPEDDDELELHVGLEGPFGVALLEANKSLKGSAEVLVPDYQVRALAMGFLDKCGV